MLCGGINNLVYLLETELYRTDGRTGKRIDNNGKVGLPLRIQLVNFEIMTKKKQIIFSSLLGIVLLVVIFIPKREEDSGVLDEVEVTDSTEVKEIVYKYGIPLR